LQSELQSRRCVSQTSGRSRSGTAPLSAWAALRLAEWPVGTYCCGLVRNSPHYYLLAPQSSLLLDISHGYLWSLLRSRTRLRKDKIALHRSVCCPLSLVMCRSTRVNNTRNFRYDISAARVLRTCDH
ncbi:unnamed protein product, partial [Mycena citricolor]